MIRRRSRGILALVSLLGCGSSSAGGGDAGPSPRDARPDGASTGTHADANAPRDASHPTDAPVAVETGRPVDASDGAVSFNASMAPSTLGTFTTKGSTGCATLGAVTGVQTVSLMVDGATRTGTVFVPAGYDPEKAYPVVFVFHGDGGTGAGIRTSLDLEPDADGKAIFVYPDGADGTWSSELVSANPDMDFVMALRTSLRSQYCVDLDRTFLTGMSRGGFFVNELACRYGIAEFAAIAPHSSTIDPGSGADYPYGPPNPMGGPYMESGAYDFACPSDGMPPPVDRPILPAPAFVIHGECDTEDGVEYPEGRRVAEHWGFAADCSSTPAVAVTTSPDSACSAPFTTNPVLTVDPCYKAPGCTAGHDVTFCAIPGMDHEIWADAHSRIWAFFAAH